LQLRLCGDDGDVVTSTHLAFHRVTDGNVSLDGERQRQPDTGVADRVGQRSAELDAVALVGQAVPERRVVVQRHRERQDEIEKKSSRSRSARTEEKCLKDRLRSSIA